MDIRKFSWARGLALLVALSVILMYSVTNVSYATIDDVRVHYSEATSTDYIEVTTFLEGTTYSAICNFTSGINYEGGFTPGIPEAFKGRLDVTNTFLLLNGTTPLAIANISASGNKSINITVEGTVPPPPLTYDLMVSKTVDDASVTLGAIVTFTVAAKNIGTGTITQAGVTDVLPPGLSQSAVSKTAGTDYNGATWTIGELLPDESKFLTISAVTTTTGSFTNVATGTASGDTTPGNNTGTATVTVTQGQEPPDETYDLAITKVVSDSSVTKGSIVTFTITAANIGNSTMSGVVVTDNIPSGLSLSGFSVSPGTTFDGTSVWTVGQLGPSEAKYLTISALTTTKGSFTNVASGTGTGDVTPANNTDTATVRVNEQGPPPPDDTYDLGITKEASNSSVQLGNEVVFLITITNSANSEITVGGIYANDIWPEGLSITAIEAEAGTSYDQGNQRWQVNSLAPGEDRVLTISAIATSLGSITNTINIGSDRVPGDTNTENDSDSATIRVYDQTIPAYDLGITKTANRTSMYLGNSVTFTITISNNENTTAYGIEVNDVWPSELTLETVTTPAGTYFDESENVWHVGTLTPDGTPGDSKTLIITATANARGTATNSVSIDQVEGTFEDDNSENNTDSVSVSVVRRGGGGGGGGTPTVTIPEPEVPQVEQPVVVPEEPAPLSDVPQTSDPDNIWLLIGLMLASGIGIGTLARRKETETETK